MTEPSTDDAIALSVLVTLYGESKYGLTYKHLPESLNEIGVDGLLRYRPAQREGTAYIRAESPFMVQVNAVAHETAHAVLAVAGTGHGGPYEEMVVQFATGEIMARAAGIRSAEWALYHLRYITAKLDELSPAELSRVAAEGLGLARVMVDDLARVADLWLALEPVTPGAAYARLLARFRAYLAPVPVGGGS